MSDINKLNKIIESGDFNSLMEYLINNPGDHNFSIGENIIGIYKKLCEKDNVRMAKLIHGLSDFDIHQDDNEIFIYSCYKGALEIAKWIYSLGCTKIDSRNYEALKLASLNNRYNIISWLINDLDIEYDFENTDLFKQCCKKNVKEVIIVLCKKKNFNFKIEEHFRDEYTHENTFHFFCRYGYHQIAELYYKEIGFDINDKNDEAIALACQEGHLEMAKWIYSIGGNINVRNDWCFFICITRNYLDLLKWIYSLGKIDINKNDEYYFRLACNTNKLDIVKWLHEVGNINFHLCIDSCFSVACLEQNIELCEFLYSTVSIDITIYFCKVLVQIGTLKVLKWIQKLNIIDFNLNDDELFRIASTYNNFEVLKWIYSLGNVNLKANNHQAFVDSCKNNNLEMANWIQKMYILNYKDCIYKVSSIDNNIVDFSIVKFIKILGKKSLDNVEICPICYNNHSEMITGCDHQFCKECFKEYADRQTVSFEEIPCPYCRQTDLKIYTINKN